MIPVILKNERIRKWIENKGKMQGLGKDGLRR